MVQITQDDLLKYLYEEGSAEDLQNVRQLLETNEDLQERFHMLKIAKDRLNQINLLSPDNRSVDKILNYAERRVVELYSTD